MYGKSVITSINKNEAPTEPLATLADVGVGSLGSIPYLPKADGYEPVGEPFTVSTEAAAVAPNALAAARDWIAETGAKYVAFIDKGALTGKLQAFDKLPA